MSDTPLANARWMIPLLTIADIEAIRASLEVAADADGDEGQEVYPGVRAALAKVTIISDHVRSMTSEQTESAPPARDIDPNFAQTVGGLIAGLYGYDLNARVVLDVDLADCHSDRNVFQIGSFVFDDATPDGKPWLFINNGKSE